MAVGLDLGGTKVYGVRLEGDEIVAEAKRKLPVEGTADDVVDILAEVAAEVAGDGGIGAVGVGSPGAIDAAGVVREASNVLGFGGRDIALAELLGERLGAAQVTIGNDVSVAVHAEWVLGAAKGVDDFIGIWCGTGVGGGLVLDGKLRRGPNGLAGEIGHTVVDLDGRRQCGCGRPGHLEAYAGRGSLELAARHRHAEGDRTELVELAGDERMTSGVFAKALARGDRVATELVDEAIEALGAAVAGAVTLLDVPVVVIGGGLADKLGPPFSARVEREARLRLFPGVRDLRVVPGALGDAAGAVGAALLAAGR